MRRSLFALTCVLLGCDEGPTQHVSPAEFALRKKVEEERAQSPAPPPGPSLPAVPPPPAAPVGTAPTEVTHVHARPAVGDFVEYEIGATAAFPDASANWKRKIVRLQAIEVTPALTRVHVSSSTIPLFGSGVVFELFEAGAATDVDDGPGTPDAVELEGKKWPCTRRRKDHRAGDGPLIEECVGSKDKALALSDGIVVRVVQPSGLGGASPTHAMRLVRSGNAPLPPPAPLAFPPGTFWVRYETRYSISSAAGRIVTTAGEQVWQQSLLEYLVALDADARRPEKLEGKPVALKLGTHTVKAIAVPRMTLGFVLGEKGEPEYFAADPEHFAAPLPVRYAVLAGKSRSPIFTDWK